MQMTAMRMPLPEALAKRINVTAAQPKGLRALFVLPPDESDIEHYIVSEFCRNIQALDSYLGIDADARNLPEQRAKAILGYVYDIPIDTPDWWPRLGWELMRKHIPGFSIGKRGRPRIWTIGRLIELLEDCRELQARDSDLKGENFYRKLRQRHPETWGRLNIPALRKAYAKAQALARKLPKPIVPLDSRSQRPKARMR
jgi:hypothetical protein